MRKGGFHALGDREKKLLGKRKRRLLDDGDSLGKSLVPADEYHEALGTILKNFERISHKGLQPTSGIKLT